MTPVLTGNIKLTIPDHQQAILSIPCCLIPNLEGNDWNAHAALMVMPYCCPKTWCATTLDKTNVELFFLFPSHELINQSQALTVFVPQYCLFER